MFSRSFVRFVHEKSEFALIHRALMQETKCTQLNQIVV